MDTPRCNCSSRNSHRKAAIEPGLPSLSLLLARKPDRLLANELYLENLYTFKSGLEPVAKRIDRIEQHSQFFSLPEPNSGNCIGPRPTADDSGTCHPAVVGCEDALAGQIERSRRDLSFYHVNTGLREVSPAIVLRSAATISATSSSNEILWCQPSFDRAFEASPTSNSTSVGRK